MTVEAGLGALTLMRRAGLGVDAPDVVGQAKTAVTVGTIVTVAMVGTAIVGGILTLIYFDEKQRAKEERAQGYKYTEGTRIFFP